LRRKGLTSEISLKKSKKNSCSFTLQKERHTMFENMSEAQARAQILAMATAYCNRFLAPKPYSKGQRIAYASRVFDSKELSNLVDSALDFWLTAGRYTDAFEAQFSKALGSAFCSLVNSGSSANLLAFMALTSPLLGERAVRRGDEVITVAAAFPTTVAPIVQFGAVPVLVDITIPQYNADTAMLEAALSEKTKAVFLAHSLGNPFDLKTVKRFCDRHRLWLIEDNCDALGSKYTIDGAEKFTGTVGDIGTSSFYPAHHMTMGEGGAVYTDNPLLHKIIRSMRDWGRDCVCPGGKDNLCGRRFDRQYGELPLGYDHKYVYSHFGYNLKVTDMQAAIGCAQLEKLPAFVERRRRNWQRLRNGLSDVQDRLILPEPAPSSTPSWFGFTLTCKDGAPATRSRLTQFIESNGVQTRALFAGNIVKHPCFDEMRQAGYGYRVVGALEATDMALNSTFWLGVYPGMTDEMVDRMVEVVKDGVRQIK
jgi:CDP-6-deoxy-D-xylo-4-hexulose-3-dehydrase